MATIRTLIAGIALAAATLTAVPADAQRSRDNDRRSQREEAPKLFPDATRESPETKVSSRLSRQMTAMIDALNEKEDPVKAREIAEQVLANERANAYEKSLAAQVAGNASVELDEVDAAVDYFQRALDENGLDNEAHYSTMQNLAITLLNDDKMAESVALLTKLVTETRTTNPELHYTLAAAYLQGDDYANGIEALKKAISLLTEPKPEWQQLLMTAYLQSENPAEAAKVGEAIVAASPDDKRSLLTLASAYLDLEQDDKAIALVEAARSRNLLTESRDYQMLYALYFNADGKEREVVNVINEGLSKGILKRDLQTLSALAQAAYFAEDMPVALATYKEAAALDPKGETGLNYAKVLSGEAEDAAARDAAKAALAKGVAKPGEAWMVIARSEAQLENRAATRAALQEAAKYAETREQANRMLQQFR